MNILNLIGDQPKSIMEDITLLEVYTVLPLCALVVVLYAIKQKKKRSASH